jgi:hypothetical protein
MLSGKLMTGYCVDMYQCHCSAISCSMNAGSNFQPNDASQHLHLFLILVFS